MTTRRPASKQRRLAQACVLAASFWFCSSAWSIDTPPAPEPLATGKAALALAKLHDITNRASELAVQALSMLGINYRYGGNSPDTGLDCSGLVRYVFKEAWGTDLPRTSAEISRVGEKVDKIDLRPGDLVFYNTLRRGFSHVGIYLGDRKFIHSPSSGGQVRIEDMDVAYWKKRFNGARRIIDDEQQPQ
jgi:cell wall-associated NlpC family hydrolase